MAMEWHTLPANYLDFQRELEETRNGFQMVKNFITDLVQVEVITIAQISNFTKRTLKDQYTSRLTYLTEKHTKCIFNSNIMATASNSILTSQAYKNLECSYHIKVALNVFIEPSMWNPWALRRILP